jgi:hypothetical protein
MPLRTLHEGQKLPEIVIAEADPAGTRVQVPIATACLNEEPESPMSVSESCRARLRLEKHHAGFGPRLAVEVTTACQVEDVANPVGAKRSITV